MADKEKKSVAQTAPDAKKAAKKADKPGKTEGQDKKKSKAVAKFFHDLKAEIKKIVWPEPRSVWKNVGTVIAMILIIGLCVFGLDEAFTNLLHQFMNVAV